MTDTEYCREIKILTYSSNGLLLDSNRDIKFPSFENQIVSFPQNSLGFFFRIESNKTISSWDSSSIIDYLDSIYVAKSAKQSFQITFACLSRRDNKRDEEEETVNKEHDVNNQRKRMGKKRIQGNSS